MRSSRWPGRGARIRSNDAARSRRRSSCCARSCADASAIGGASTRCCSALFGPILVGFMLNRVADRQRESRGRRLPVVGIEHAPALVDWLRQQSGVEVVAGPADPEQAVRDRDRGRGRRHPPTTSRRSSARRGRRRSRWSSDGSRHSVAAEGAARARRCCSATARRSAAFASSAAA